MKHLIAGIALLLGAHLGAYAQTAEDLNRIAKQAGNEAAAALAGKSPQIDANGNPVLDAQGKPVMQTSTAANLQNGLQMFQGITGVQGVSPLSSPAQGGGYASIAVRKSFDFNCSNLARTAAPQSAGPLSFKVDACQRNVSGAVTFVDLKVCDNALRAGTCDTSSDFSKLVRATAGQYASFQGTSLGLGCNSAGACQLTVEGSFQTGGTDASMRAGAGAAAGQSNVLSQYRDIVERGDYAKQMEEVGRPLAKCSQANLAANPGDAVTCDESNPQAVKVLATKANTSSSCTGVRRCISEATANTTFVRSCNRTFPLTERVTTNTYAPTESCLVTTYTDTSKPAVNSCISAGVDKTQGMTRVGQTADSCTANDASGACSSLSRTEYWAKVDTPASTSQASRPSRVGGACDTRLSSPTRTSTCDQWFGRTLPADQCNAVSLTGPSAAFAPYMELSYAQKEGCGICTQANVSETCYGVNDPTASEASAGADSADSCTGMDLNGCSMTSATPLTYSGVDGGLVTSQRETYSCTTQSRQCVQWATEGEGACSPTDLTQGTESYGKRTNTLDGSFNSAMIAAATLDDTGKSLEGSQDPKVPRLFTGEPLGCKRPVGGLGMIVSRNCCRADLQRPEKGNIIQGGCSMDEVKLAAAKRSSYATYTGSSCSREIGWGPFKVCVETTDRYCVFPGILPRLVQEQGRVQLAELVASGSGAGAEQAPLNFRYYDTGNGAWSALATVNGVRTAAWQWPSYCSDPVAANDKLMNEPGARSCPGTVTAWVAACDIPSGCGPLPDDPYSGALNWTLKNVDPLQATTTAVSKYSVVKGACNTETSTCQYQVSALPVGVGGRAVVTKDLTW